MDTKRKVFVSFRFSDGEKSKENLIEFLEKEQLIIDKSEDVDRSNLSEEAIKEYLYEKLRDSSITIVILTPQAVNYKRNQFNEIDDWLYDELRYSMYNRKGNPINGVIALYTPQAKNMIMTENTHICEVCNEQSVINSIKHFDNLIKDNMMNVKPKFKLNKCEDIYDSDYDSYISLIPIEKFYDEPKKFIDYAIEKREKSEQYEIHVIKK